MGAAADRREGRGRLSSLDLLPDEAEGDLIWALDALRERAMPQNAILDEFNARLADRGIGKVSKSAFNRWSIRKARQFRRLDEVRAITGDIVGNLETDTADNVTVAVAEMLKAAVYEQLEGENNSKALLELSRTVKAAVDAQRASADYRRKLQDEMLAKVDKAIDRAGETPGAPPNAEAVLKRIREDVYGIFAK